MPESHKHAKIKMADPQYVPKGSTAEALLRERGIRLVETEDKGGYWVDTGVLPNALKRVVRESVPQGDDIVTFWENGERKFIRFEGKRGRDGTARTRRRESPTRSTSRTCSTRKGASGMPSGG